jgi:hypothetical protein
MEGLGQQQLARVDQFLLDLYTRLDEAHMTYEGAIRGKNVSAPELDPQVIRFGDPTDVPGELSPPFNRAGRLGGDLDEITRSGTTAVENLQDTWDSFGRTLKEESNLALYTTRRDANQRELNRLKEEKANLETSKATGSTVVTNTVIGFQGQEARLQAVDREIAKLEQEIAKDTLKIKQIGS